MLYNAQVSVLSENVYFAMGPMDIVAYKACFFYPNTGYFFHFYSSFFRNGLHVWLYMLSKMVENAFFVWYISLYIRIEQFLETVHFLWPSAYLGTFKCVKSQILQNFPQS